MIILIQYDGVILLVRTLSITLIECGSNYVIEWLYGYNIRI